MTIEYLPHTADIRMKIGGSSVEELFQAGVIGMGNILKEGFCDKNKSSNIKSKIEIVALDQTCLLIDLLSEVLSTSYSEKSIFCKVLFTKFTRTKAVVEIYGTRVEGFNEEIKAVTYHEANVHKDNHGNWETLVIFDI
ncbi:archease [Maribacter halichondriae]|uniref:archease n=1 Tax=Maribacter halichondriae TaxID=2980554 RepID=UPI002358C413|nr:archease [Maribacter sp. Hal144]